MTSKFLLWTAIGLVLWTSGAVMGEQDPKLMPGYYGYNCADEKFVETEALMNGKLKTCLSGKYGTDKLDPSDGSSNSKESCCLSYETFCVRNQVYNRTCVKKEGSGYSMSGHIGKLVAGCNAKLSIDLSLDYCKSLEKKSADDEECKKYMPCDPRANAQAPKGSGDGSPPAAADPTANTETKKSSAPAVGVQVVVFVSTLAVIWFAFYR